MLSHPLIDAESDNEDQERALKKQKADSGAAIPTKLKQAESQLSDTADAAMPPPATQPPPAAKPSVSSIDPKLAALRAKKLAQESDSDESSDDEDLKQVISDFRAAHSKNQSQQNQQKKPADLKRKAPEPAQHAKSASALIDLKDKKAEPKRIIAKKSDALKVKPKIVMADKPPLKAAVAAALSLQQKQSPAPKAKDKPSKAKTNTWFNSQYNSDAAKAQKYIRQLEDAYIYTGAGSFVADDFQELFCVLVPKVSKRKDEPATDKENMKKKQLAALADSIEKTDFAYRKLFRFKFLKEIHNQSNTGSKLLFKIELDESELKKTNKTKPDILKEFMIWKQAQIKTLITEKPTTSFSLKDRCKRAELYLEHTLKLEQKALEAYKSKLHKTAAAYEGSTHPDRHLGSFIALPAPREDDEMLCGVLSAYTKSSDAEQDDFIKRMQEALKKSGHAEIVLKKIDRIIIAEQAYLLVTANATPQKLKEFLSWQATNMQKWKPKEIPDASDDPEIWLLTQFKKSGHENPKHALLTTKLALKKALDSFKKIITTHKPNKSDSLLRFQYAPELKTSFALLSGNNYEQLIEKLNAFVKAKGLCQITIKVFKKQIQIDGIDFFLLSTEGNENEQLKFAEWSKKISQEAKSKAPANNSMEEKKRKKPGTDQTKKTEDNTWIRNRYDGDIEKTQLLISALKRAFLNYEGAGSFVLDNSEELFCVLRSKIPSKSKQEMIEQRVKELTAELATTDFIYKKLFRFAYTQEHAVHNEKGTNHLMLFEITLDEQMLATDYPDISKATVLKEFNDWKQKNIATLGTDHPTSNFKLKVPKVEKKPKQKKHKKPIKGIGYNIILSFYKQDEAKAVTFCKNLYALYTGNRWQRTEFAIFKRLASDPTVKLLAVLLDPRNGRDLDIWKTTLSSSIFKDEITAESPEHIHFRESGGSHHLLILKGSEDALRRFYEFATNKLNEKQIASGKWLAEKIPPAVREEKDESPGMRYLEKLMGKQAARDFVLKLSHSSKSHDGWGRFIELPKDPDAMEDRDTITFFALLPLKRLGDAKVHCNETLANKFAEPLKSLVQFNHFEDKQNFSPLPLEDQETKYWLVACTMPAQYCNNVNALINKSLSEATANKFQCGGEGLKTITEHCKGNAAVACEILTTLHSAYKNAGGKVYPMTFHETPQRCYILSTRETWKSLKEIFLAQIAGFDLKDQVVLPDQYLNVSIADKRWFVYCVEFNNLQNTSIEKLSKQFWDFLQQKHQVTNNQEIILLNTKRRKNFEEKTIQIDPKDKSHLEKQEQPELVNPKKATEIRKAAAEYARKLIKNGKSLPSATGKRIKKQREKSSSPEIFDKVFYPALVKAFAVAKKALAEKQKIADAEKAEALLFSDVTMGDKQSELAKPSASVTEEKQSPGAVSSEDPVEMEAEFSFDPPASSKIANSDLSLAQTAPTDELKPVLSAALSKQPLITEEPAIDLLAEDLPEPSFDGEEMQDGAVSSSRSASPTRFTEHTLVKTLFSNPADQARGTQNADVQMQRSSSPVPK